MSECSSSGVTEDAAGDRPPGLTWHAIEGVLADFRGWLEQAAAAGDLAEAEGQEADEPLDLHTLLGQFTALRHEVNLQTRAVRAQQEQNADTLGKYGEALERLQTVQSEVREADERALDDLLRPLLKSLVDAYDALVLARGQVENVLETVLPVLEKLTAPTEPLPELPVEPDLEPEPVPGSVPPSAAPGVLGRLFGRPTPPPTVVVDERWQTRAAQLSAWSETLREELHKTRQFHEEQQASVRQAAEAAERVELIFDSVLQGYTMSLQRLERALQQCDLEAIACVGEPFDPELMEAVEVATQTDRPPNEVVEEVRRGYLWRGRVFRCALVRVAK